MSQTQTLALLLQPTKPWKKPTPFPLSSSRPFGLGFRSSPPEIGRISAAASKLGDLVDAFDPVLPLNRSLMPPSSWYTDPAFLQLELDRVFFRGWQVAGFAEHVQNPGDFFTGRLGNVDYVICWDGNGELRAFHNVCSHRATVLMSGRGRKSCLVCPYHGWTYGLDGALMKANRTAGIENFNEKEFGLVPINVCSWGPFILISLDKDVTHQQNARNKNIACEWLGDASEILDTHLDYSSLSHICRREYNIKSNWKAFCDNYLDGGYHLPYAHKGLSSNLKLDAYRTKVYERVSIQSCEGSTTSDLRVGSTAFYVFVYPNFMINRYGPWMDTNLVLPLGPDKCQVIFDYFLDGSLLKDSNFIEKSLEASNTVQMEDVEICERVQRGLESPAYCSGRYVPSVEMAAHHFHCLLHQSLKEP